MNLLIVGNPAPAHIGRHLMDAATDLGVSATIADVRQASKGPLWKQRLSWHLLGHRPCSLGEFNRYLLRLSKEVRPDVVVTTGIAPVTAETLAVIRAAGATTINYQTDDPWSPANCARHFWPALLEYDIIFSPRKTVIPDLCALGCRVVEYLPFAYNPKVHFVEAPPTAEKAKIYRCDLAIIGGADRDRYPLAEAALHAGFKLRLYGGYWERNRELRPLARGFVLGQELRWAAVSASVNLCMGRKANRDGHAMRSYELPAMGATLVVEDTEDHRNLFGAEGECVLYYSSTIEMVDKVRTLLHRPDLRGAMAQRAHARVTSGANTYAERLKVMVGAL